jgi:hypothetical protein
MSLGQRTLSLWPVCLLAVLGSAPTAERSEESSETRIVRSLVTQLGSEQFAERERAAGRLEDIGFPALKFLRRAARSGDLETRRRAMRLIASITGRASQALATARILDREVTFFGIEDPKTKLDMSLYQLGKVYDLPLVVDEKAFRNDGVEDPLDCRIVEGNPIPPIKGELKRVLKSIVLRIPARSGAAYLVRKNVVEITTQAAVRSELGMKKDEELLPLVSEYFCEEPLAQVLDTLSETSEYNVILDPRLRGKTGDTAVTARLINVPVDTAVRLVADMAGLSVVRQANVFYVTSSENATRMNNDAPRRRIPPLRDVVGLSPPKTP